MTSRILTEGLRQIQAIKSIIVFALKATKSGDNFIVFLLPNKNN